MNPQKKEPEAQTLDGGAETEKGRGQEIVKGLVKAWTLVDAQRMKQVWGWQERTIRAPRLNGVRVSEVGSTR